jgi:hypothetical protein
MKPWLAILVVVAAGCSQHHQASRMTGPACVGLAFASLAPAETPVEPAKCCGRCGKNGLPRGKVRSGDGVAIIDCGCPASCECKQPAAPAAAATPRATADCTTGACRLR